MRRWILVCAIVSLFDVGDKFRQRAGCETDTVILVRPDDHIAAIVPMKDGVIDEIYARITGAPSKGECVMADTPERIALDVHAHLAPIFPG